jgi:hypothetical protein
MFFHLKPILLSLIILGGYELIVYHFEWGFWIIIPLLLIVIFGTRIATNSWHNSLLAILFFAGSAILLFFVSGGVFIQAYILVSALTNYLIILGVYRLNSNPRDETAQKISFITSLTVVFIWAASLFAIYLNRNIGSWVISLLFYGIVVLATHQLLKTTLLDKKKTKYFWFYSFAVAYCLGVISWGAFFLPFGYLTISLLLLIIYFFLADYLIKSIRKEFSKAAFLTDLFVFLVSAGSVLFSTRWEILE